MGLRKYFTVRRKQDFGNSNFGFQRSCPLHNYQDHTQIVQNHLNLSVYKATKNQTSLFSSKIYILINFEQI